MAAKGDGVMPDWPDEKSELIGALRRHVWTLSAEIGERSGLRGDGLQRAERYLLRALRAMGLGSYGAKSRILHWPVP